MEPSRWKVSVRRRPEECCSREVFEETGLVIHSSDLVELGTRCENIETKHGMEAWNGELYACKTFHGEIRKMEEAEEPSWLRMEDVLEGKYRMPKMSSEYSWFIMRTLCD
jgi:ADP-ribose pyrophosphatase YjhB (NUDIX family)